MCTKIETTKMEIVIMRLQKRKREVKDEMDGRNEERCETSNLSEKVHKNRDKNTWKGTNVNNHQD